MCLGSIHSIPYCHFFSIRFSLLRTFVLLVICVVSARSQPLPTRQVDLWGTTTSPRLLPGQHARDNEIIVQLTIGSLVGHRMVVPNLSWTPNKDPRDEIPGDRGPRDPDPLPLKNNVTVFTFLGVPYAEAPTGNRRFKVRN